MVKKMLIFVLFFLIASSVTVYAETWRQYRDRAHTMERRSGDFVSRTHHNTWCVDTWGALIATSAWLIGAFDNISRNFPGLSAEEREIYRRIANRRRAITDDFQTLVRLTHPHQNTRNRIADRIDHWGGHLVNGGLIIFN